MQRKVVRRARTRVASPAQADGPSFRPVGRRTPARLRPRPTEFQILQTTPLRMGSVWANITRTKVGVGTEQQPNISSAPNAFQTEPGRPKLNNHFSRCNPKPHVLATSRTPERARCGRFPARLHRAPPFRLSRAVQIPGTTSSFQLCGGIASTETLPRAHGEMESEVESVVTPLIPHSIRSS